MLQLAEENSGWRKNWGQTMAWIFISSGMFGKPKSEENFIFLPQSDSHACNKEENKK